MKIPFNRPLATGEEFVYIKEAVDSLGEVIGLTVKEDVLDQIFSRFCIGK